jgi:hypothetical protein
MHDDLKVLLTRKITSSVVTQWGKIAVYSSVTDKDDILTNALPPPSFMEIERKDFFERFLFKYANSNVVATNFDGSVRWIINGHRILARHQPFIGVGFLDSGVLKVSAWPDQEYTLNIETGLCTEESLRY